MLIIGRVNAVFSSLVASALMLTACTAAAQERLLAQQRLPSGTTEMIYQHGFDVSADGRSVFYPVAEPFETLFGKNTRLFVYDVGELIQPRLISELPLGDLRPGAFAVRGDRLFLLYDEKAEQPPPYTATHLAIWDVRDPDHLEKASDITVSGAFCLLPLTESLRSSSIRSAPTAPPVASGTTSRTPGARSQQRSEIARPKR